MKQKTGFTLIELLVATTIIIVLSAIGVVSYMQAGKGARDSRRKADMETVRQAMVLYRAENGAYPVAAEYGGGTNGNIRYDNLVNYLNNQGFLSNPMPDDPKDEGAYTYTLNSATGTNFCICAQLENITNGNLGTRMCANDGTFEFYCVQGS